MARSGDIVEHPRGERVIFRRTAQETHGALLQFDAFFVPGSGVTDQHKHPRQEERFTVVDGLACFLIGRQKRELSPGDRIVVPPGALHAFYNSGPAVLHLSVEVRPALRTEQMFETLFGLVQDRRLAARPGVPDLLQLAALAHAFRDELRLPWHRDALVRLFGPLGRRLGCPTSYPYPHA